MNTLTAVIAPVNVDDALTLIANPWQPHRLVSVNDQEVKAVKLLGEFVWHHHEVDELFYVLSGELSIDIREGDAGTERTVVLKNGDMLVIPKLMEHRPHCESEVQALLFEPRGVVNTGNAGGDLTSKVHEL